MVCAVSPEASIHFLGKGIQMLLPACVIQILLLFWWMFNPSLLPGLQSGFGGGGGVCDVCVILFCFFLQTCSWKCNIIFHLMGRELGVSIWSFSSLETASHRNRCEWCEVYSYRNLWAGNCLCHFPHTPCGILWRMFQDGWCPVQTALLSSEYVVQSRWLSIKATLLAFFALKPSKK